MKILYKYIESKHRSYEGIQFNEIEMKDILPQCKDVLLDKFQREALKEYFQTLQNEQDLNYNLLKK